ncbi:hypothetical protein G6F59_017702 [Rhizopus arrhizus]|nr:hypothetical protein G6F59_017702 [Rhizopus arrhizus]
MTTTASSSALPQATWVKRRLPNAAVSSSSQVVLAPTATHPHALAAARGPNATPSVALAVADAPKAAE